MAHAYTPASSTSASARGRIPTPNRASSSIPTTGRSRAGSTVNAAYASPLEDSPGMSRALSDAIRANDPKQHRPGPRLNDQSQSKSHGHSPNPSPSPQPGALPLAQSGRKSVTPTSARVGTYTFTPRASTSTNTSRPESRQSDARVKGGKDRTFEPGEAVRIESLGMEGTLRFLGSIAGKPGVWAGVELAPGFAGRGKNDGTVDGVSYFTCAPKCGVFVASSKLSATIPRPSSVASSFGRTTPSLPPISGRVTPAFSASGRGTPAFSAGRATPARSVSGRVTPSFATPAARPRHSIAAPGTTPVARPRKTNVVAETSFTAGSRASRYLNMTAQELQNARNGIESKPASPTRISSSSMSPFATPKPSSSGRPSVVGIPTPGGIKSRQSAGGFGFGGGAGGTPRSGRKTEMLPPPSPVSPSKRALTGSPSLKVGLTAASPNDQLSDLETRNRELQERIANLMNGKPVNGDVSPAQRLSVSPSEHSQHQPDAETLATLEAEKKRANEEAVRATTALARVAELETQVRFNERAVKERESRIEALERSFKTKEDEVEKARLDSEVQVRELSGKLGDADSLIISLKAVVEEVREGKKEETEAIIGAKDKEIELLSGKVNRLASELEEERRELGSQIEELRLAGQETIALYEEKLSEADSKRWEMEDLVRDLEDKVRKQKRSMSPGTIARHASEAAQIDNETLREQVTHFERKVNQLEAQLDGAREAAEREEQAMRARIAKYKENDGALKRDLAEARADVESRKRAESTAKARLEELEEALRENAVALENARAEIEGLRAELANLEGLQAGAEVANNAKADEDAIRRGLEKARLDEISQLKELLDNSRTAKREALEQYETAKQEAESAVQDKNNRLTVEQKTVVTLKQDLEARHAELERLRTTATHQRDSVYSNGSRTSRHEHHEEEIAGLKHIIQELNKENLDITTRIKLVESDKRLLQEECDELREAIRILEGNVNEELKALDGEASNAGLSGDAQKALRDIKAKHELELGQLRQKLLEAEQKHAQVVNDLNKEVNELETLVESKIYREDDLERELERYKDKLARATQRKLSKTSGESSLAPPSDTVSKKSATTVSEHTPPDGDVCEICEEPGHDIFSCHLLQGDTPSTNSSTRKNPSVTDSESSDLWCEDCESTGHTAADCPHSMDIF
ncbi:hypothetical protein BU17DRAFT_36275 [Hysterangium stoloniferum]|nr:hypothetical protein BU17DRAFT_36275 [Hysterangium stoloniferum]